MEFIDVLHLVSPRDFSAEILGAYESHPDRYLNDEF